MQPTSSRGPSGLEPPSGSWSRQDWVAQSAGARVAFLSVEMPRLCEALGPIVIFLEGSALHGELCGIMDPAGGRRYLSDLDLGILTKRRVQPGFSKIAALRIEAEAFERIGEGPTAKLGFYCEDDLGAQDPTPGFVEAIRRPFVLWGDPGALARFRVPEYERIPPWEGSRLVSNRVLEWLGSRKRDDVASLYAAAKLMADAAEAALLWRRAYRGGGYGTRLDAALRLEGFQQDERERMRAWTDWRVDPRWEMTPLRVGLSDLDVRLVEEHLRASILTSMRFAVATEEPGAFLRSSTVRGRVWARSWKRWLRRYPGSLAGLRAGCLRRTPRVLLFEAAICCAIGRTEAAREIATRLLGGDQPVGMSNESLGARIAEVGETMSREGID